ncbi:hypothetical protein EVAR_92846_1 [Eumeta japonica]|uniref:Uncharacterized protein n=1 Tax=Eumeta variegata TaxID=151549 RepID=A0A4C1TDC9_EUMVA|nr:hypothetical protein EVAR_92846_1 [Eumeta japonica]
MPFHWPTPPPIREYVLGTAVRAVAGSPYRCDTAHTWGTLKALRCYKKKYTTGYFLSNGLKNSPSVTCTKFDASKSVLKTPSSVRPDTSRTAFLNAAIASSGDDDYFIY